MKLKSGSLIFRGDLISFDGKVFKLKTSEFGHISVDAEKFECITPNCHTLLEIFLLISKRKQNQGGEQFSAASISPVRKPTHFNITGSSTIGDKLMPALLHAFAKRNGFLHEQQGDDNSEIVKILIKQMNGKVLTSVDLRRKGSSTAFKALENKKALIGMASRRIKLAEVQKLEKAGLKNMLSKSSEHIIGVDGVLIVVSPRNTVTSLTMDQLAKIFSGEIRDWAQVGGPAGKITVMAPGDKSGTLGTFRSVVLKPKQLTLRSDAIRVNSKSEMAKEVAKNENAIGITGFAYKGETRALYLATSCGIVHSPTQFNVNTNEYPLSRRLYLYTPDRIDDKYAKHFLKFVKDAASTESILKKNGFISRNLTLQSFHEQGKRMAGIFAASDEEFDMNLMKQFSRELRHASRLSFTIRFRPSSFKFDTESEQIFTNLGRFLVQHKMQNNYFIVAGFSDSAGSFEANLKLSRQRAEQVYRKMIASTQGAVDPAKVVVKSYGELLPVACNDTDRGRAKNRRVEIWSIRPEHWPAGVFAQDKRAEAELPQLSGRFKELLSE